MNILAIDAGIVAYRVNSILSQVEEDIDKVVGPMISWYENRLFVNSPEPLAVIWLMDFPPYWRSDFEPEYKANRYNPKPKNVNHFFRAIRQSSCVTYAQKGFEADDLAGQLARQYTDGHIYLYTSDSDWGGLVSDNVTMLSPYSPNIRTRAEVYSWYAKQFDRGPKKHLPLKKDFFSFSPEDVWEAKTILGDRSDNLPAGTDLGLFSLANPLIKPQTLDLRSLTPVSFCPRYAAEVAMNLPEVPCQVLRISP